MGRTPRQRFAAVKIQPPCAADHDPPKFDFGEKVPMGLFADNPSHPPILPPPPDPGETKQAVFPAVVLTGFHRVDLNVLFVQRKAPAFRLAGRETYWSASGSYFLFHSESTGTWAADKAKYFDEIKAGRSGRLVHSPKGYDI